MKLCDQLVRLSDLNLSPKGPICRAKPKLSRNPTVTEINIIQGLEDECSGDLYVKSGRRGRYVYDVEDKRRRHLSGEW